MPVPWREDKEETLNIGKSVANGEPLDRGKFKERKL
jgi:hypothetical protein